MWKAPEFSPFWRKSLGRVRHFSKANFTILSRFRLGGWSFSGGNFRVFADENGTYPCELLEGASPSIQMSPMGFLRNAECAESAGIFEIFGEILRGASALF